MHLHFRSAGVGSQESGVRMAPPCATLFGFGPRSSDSRPCNRFFWSFVFNNISGCTFIFEEQESGDSSQKSAFRRWRQALLDFGRGTASFVFIHIPAWNVIFREARIAPRPGLRTPDLSFHTHSGLERPKSLSRAAASPLSQSTSQESAFAYGRQSLWTSDLGLRHLTPRT